MHPRTWRQCRPTAAISTGVCLTFAVQAGSVRADAPRGVLRTANRARLPRGHGNLFGIAFRPDGKPFYDAGDDMDSAVESR
jgi:hypothetical protein